MLCRLANDQHITVQQQNYITVVQATNTLHYLGCMRLKSSYQTHQTVG